MSVGQTKYAWDKKNSMFVGVKFMNKADGELIEYMEKMVGKGVPKGFLIKKALREYMTNHPEG